MSEKIIQAAEEIVRAEGAESLTVRKILQKLGITNRVFYNRFSNIDVVLHILYRNTVQKVRGIIGEKIDSKKDFFEHVTDLVTNSLIVSYDYKMRFSQYIFENDSLVQSNYEWWTSEIKKLVDYAKAHNYIKSSVDSDSISYSIWCFCRGYNADAVGRGIPKDVAVRQFRHSFSFLLEGLKA